MDNSHQAQNLDSTFFSPFYKTIFARLDLSEIVGYFYNANYEPCIFCTSLNN